MRSIDTLENQQGTCIDRADAFVWCVLYPFLTIHSTKEIEREMDKRVKNIGDERERERETAATWSWSIIQLEQTFLTEKILLIHIHPVIISLSHSRFSFYFFYSVYCWDRKNEKKLHTIYKKRIFGKRGQRALLNVKRIRKRCCFSLLLSKDLGICVWMALRSSLVIGEKKTYPDVFKFQTPNSPITP
jgi:hypothetical protein